MAVTFVDMCLSNSSAICGEVEKWDSVLMDKASVPGFGLSYGKDKLTVWE